MSKIRLGFIAFFLAILSMYAFHRWNRLSLESDPAATLALSSARTETKPLIDVLEQYHLAHGVYPKSVKELPKDSLWGKYLYEVMPLNAVYKSLDCQQRVRDWMGWQTADKRQRMLETQEECILGYSQFVLKSQVPALRQRKLVFVVFESTNPTWDVDWCSPGRHGRNFCFADLTKLREENRQ
jgi:hypothetical protein